MLNIDIAPAIIKAAGQNVPGCMQGEDFSELYLKNSSARWRKDFYYEHPFVTNEQRIPSSEALVTKYGKYILWPFYNYEEFFDLIKDPFEKHNAILDTRYAEELNAMKIRFQELKEKAQ